MPAQRFRPTYIPYGLTDPSRRKIVDTVTNSTITFTKYSCETNGQYFDTNCWIGKGGGGGLHQHMSYSETPRTTKGVLGVTIGSDRILLKKGEAKTVHPGESHLFDNPSKTEDVYFDTLIEPASEGYEQVLHILYGLAADGQVAASGKPKSLVATSLFPFMADLHFPTLSFWAVFPLLYVLYWYAEWSGEKDRLLRKYYGVPVSEAADWRKKIS